VKNAGDEIKAWAQRWKAAGQALEAVKRRELQALDESRYLETMDGLLQWACDHAQERLTSGLVEQQRVFSRIRRRLNQ
jgi:hypothetical protein